MQRSKYTEWHLPFACVTVILLSTLYTHHSYHKLLLDCSKQHILQELASMQIAGIILAYVAISALKKATYTGKAIQYASTHPMIPPAAARRRQQMPLV